MDKVEDVKGVLSSTKLGSKNKVFCSGHGNDSVLRGVLRGRIDGCDPLTPGCVCFASPTQLVAIQSGGLLAPPIFN